MFSSIGAEAFAERSRRELLATGETIRKRTVETLGDLTAQEAQIAALAGDGHTNPEIGDRLFISPRTVEYHLHKVFGKLGIRSRNELGDMPRVSGASGAILREPHRLIEAARTAMRARSTTWMHPWARENGAFHAVRLSR